MKQIMENQHLTVKELAEETYISKSSVQDYLKGRRSMGIDTLELIAHNLHVPIEYLISGKTAASPPKDSLQEILTEEIRAMHPLLQPVATECLQPFLTLMELSNYIFANDPNAAAAQSTRRTAVYRYCLYEIRDAPRATYSYGILAKERQGEQWLITANIAPFSQDRGQVAHLAQLCTEQQLDPIHLQDVVSDFLRDGPGSA